MSGLCETEHLLLHQDNRPDTDTVSSSTHSIDDILGNGKDNNGHHCVGDDANADKGKSCCLDYCTLFCYTKPTKNCPSIKHNSSIIRFNYSSVC